MTAAVTEILDARTPVTYVWSYEPSRDDLRSLYDKAKQEGEAGAVGRPHAAAVAPRGRPRGGEPPRRVHPDLRLADLAQALGAC